MRILVLSPALYDTSPGQRFRIEQWARCLEGDGFQSTFVPFEDAALHKVLYQAGRYPQKAFLICRALARRLVVLTRVSKFDLIFVPRESTLLGPAIIERLVVLLGMPLVYDFDDPIWMPYHSPTNGVLSRLKWPSKTAAICRLATRVIVGNRLLANWAQQHSKAVDVIPSTIDLRQYPNQVRTPSTGELKLGWTGSHSTLPFLDLVRNPLRRLTETVCFRLLVISHTDRYEFDPGHVETVAKKWSAATEAADLQEIDIGLGPFPNEGWTPWRCHGKVLQYMAAGIPCVASNIGILPDYIQDGVNGFLANNEDEWVAKVSLLAQNPELRARIGKSGRATIEQHYSAERWAQKFKAILLSAVNCPVSSHEPAIRSEND